MFETHHVVGLMTQFNQALGRRDGYRKHEPLRIAQMRGAQCCPVRCAGGDAVVDHDSGASSDFGAFAAAQIQLAPPLDLRELGPAGGGKIRLFDAGVLDNVLIEHDNRGSAVDDRPHRQFRLEKRRQPCGPDEIEAARRARRLPRRP